jgi:hypothetical protein
MSLPIHAHIVSKLDYFHAENKVPNIIFNGPLGSGKKTLVNNFIRRLYDDNAEYISQYVIHVNCAHGKGIQFIREDLRLFSKTNTISRSMFKAVVLNNADKLTCDAQSALRRCIEQFSFNTRFFIVTSNKCKLLKPILSRFAIIHVPLPIIDGCSVNLHVHMLHKVQSTAQVNTRFEKFKQLMRGVNPGTDVHDLPQIIDGMYEKGYSALDMSRYIEEADDLSTIAKYRLLIHLDKMKREYRNESLLMATMLYFIAFRDTEPIRIDSFV